MKSRGKPALFACPLAQQEGTLKACRCNSAALGMRDFVLLECVWVHRMVYICTKRHGTLHPSVLSPYTPQNNVILEKQLRFVIWQL